MKKIYIVGKNFSNQIGGPANIIRGLAISLKKKNIDVVELCLNEKCGKFALIQELFKIAVAEKDCVINIHTDGLFLPYLVYLFSKIDKKNSYYLTVHGLYRIEAKMNGTYKKKYDRIESKLCRQFPRIICVSQLLKEKVISTYKRKKPIYVVPNGIDTIDLELNEKHKKISMPIKMIMLGGIRDRKGVLESLDVLYYLNSNGIEAYLDIYGSIENQGINAKFEEKLLTFGLKDRVAYKGVLGDKNEVYKALIEADIQLCLSKWDTFNVAIIESLAIGTPCIATDLCGASSAITEDVNGIVVNLADPDYMSNIFNYIVKIIANKNNESYEIYERSLGISKEYSWNEITNLYLNIFNLKAKSN